MPGQQQDAPHSKESCSKQLKMLIIILKSLQLFICVMLISFLEMNIKPRKIQMQNSYQHILLLLLLLFLLLFFFLIFGA